MSHLHRSLKVWLLAAMATAACSKAKEDAASSAAPSPKATIAEPAPNAEAKPPEPTPLEVLMTKDTLEGAIAYVRPQMTDTNDETSPGALLLGIWAAKHLKWSDVAVTKNETSSALVHKDSDASRGKRMCVRGSIIQIAKSKIDATSAVFNGLLVVGYSDLFSFIAAGSTGELVEQSRARLCGVVIGTYDYSNSGGGKGHAVSMVGMFDLPENRTP